MSVAFKMLADLHRAAHRNSRRPTAGTPRARRQVPSVTVAEVKRIAAIAAGREPSEFDFLRPPIDVPGQPVANPAALAARISQAGATARAGGRPLQPAAGSLAAKILAAGQRRRGEI